MIHSVLSRPIPSYLFARWDADFFLEIKRVLSRPISAPSRVYVRRGAPARARARSPLMISYRTSGTIGQEYENTGKKGVLSAVLSRPISGDSPCP